jgi:hypothetical protein
VGPAFVALRARGAALGNRQQLFPPEGPSRSEASAANGESALLVAHPQLVVASSAPQLGHSPGQSFRHNGFTGSASAITSRKNCPR